MTVAINPKRVAEMEDTQRNSIGITVRPTKLTPVPTAIANSGHHQLPKKNPAMSMAKVPTPPSQAAASKITGISPIAG